MSIPLLSDEIRPKRMAHSSIIIKGVIVVSKRAGIR